MKTFIRYFALSIFALDLCVLPLAAKAEEALAPRPLPSFDPGALPTGVAKFDLYNNGELAGEWYLERLFEDGQYITRGGTTLLPDIRESEVLIVDAVSLAPKRILVDADFSRSIFDVDLTWDGRRLTGAYTLKQPNATERTVQPIDKKTPEEITLRGATFSLIPALPLEVGATFPMRWYNFFVNGTEDINLVVEGTETVTVPAGTFDAFIVQIRDSSTENTVYVSKEKPRKILRVDVIGQNMYFVRQADPVN